MSTKHDGKETNRGNIVEEYLIGHEIRKDRHLASLSDRKLRTYCEAFYEIEQSLLGEFKRLSSERQKRIEKKKRNQIPGSAHDSSGDSVMTATVDKEMSQFCDEELESLCYRVRDGIYLGNL